MDLDRTSAVVLLSGGQDSTTCLVWAQRRFTHVRSLAIDYGQRHRIELQAAQEVAKRAGVAHAVLPCDSFAALGGNALTGAESVSTTVNASSGLPNTFVPGRNLIFLTLAAAFAWKVSAANLVTGVCETDFSGYPDCRQSTIDALQIALNQGMDAPFTIHTPLMHLSKAQTVYLARDLGALPLLAWSHTCYQGSIPPCGLCPACLLRSKGFQEAQIPDPLIERLSGR
jgi:7-cyano-7-deazaguanine synthase